VYYRIVEIDDLTVDFNRERNEDRIVVHPQHALGERRLAIPGRTVNEYGALRD
jgi:hypothetical protein